MTNLPQRVNDEGWHGHDGDSYDYSEFPLLYVHLAYITLPYKAVTESMLEEDVIRANGYDSDGASTGRYEFASTIFSIIDPDMLAIDERKLARFTRFMRFFNLEPFISPAHAMSLAARQQRKELAGLMSSTDGDEKLKPTALFKGLAEVMSPSIQSYR